MMHRTYINPLGLGFNGRNRPGHGIIWFCRNHQFCFMSGDAWTLRFFNYFRHCNRCSWCTVCRFNNSFFRRGGFAIFCPCNIFGFVDTNSWATLVFNRGCNFCNRRFGDDRFCDDRFGDDGFGDDRGRFWDNFCFGHRFGHHSIRRCASV